MDLSTSESGGAELTKQMILIKNTLNCGMVLTDSMLAQCINHLGPLTITMEAKAYYDSYILPYVGTVRIEDFMKYEPLLRKLYNCVATYETPIREHMLRQLQPNETVTSLLAAQRAATVTYFENALPCSKDSRFTTCQQFDTWFNENIQRKVPFQPDSPSVSLLRCDVSEFFDLVTSLTLRMQGKFKCYKTIN